MLQGMKSVWWQRPKWRETATSQGMPAIVSNASSQETGVEPTLSSKPPKKPILSTPWFQISSLQNADRINCCCFKPLSLRNLWRQLWETSTPTWHRIRPQKRMNWVGLALKGENLDSEGIGSKIQIRAKMQTQFQFHQAPFPCSRWTWLMGLSTPSYGAR